MDTLSLYLIGYRGTGSSLKTNECDSRQGEYQPNA